MVLADIDPPRGDDYNSSSLNDDDPYSSTSGSTDPSRPPFRYDPNALPIVFPIVGPLIGFSETRKRAVVDQELGRYAQHMRRPLTDRESEILAGSIATRVTYPSWVAPPMLAYMFRRHLHIERTRGEFSLLLFNAKVERCSPARFNLPETPFHRIFFSSLRVAPATFAWLVGARFIASSMHMVTFAQTVLGNPELDDLRKELRKGRGPVPPPQQRGLFGGMMQGPPQPQPPPPSPAPSADGMSPTSGWGDSAPTQDTPGPMSSPYGARNDPRWGQSSSTPDYDDASPTAGAPPETTWDRIRREAQSGQQPGGQQRPGVPRWSRQSQPASDNYSSTRDDGDMFSFSKADEESHLAKSEAQRDFDARVERERRGRDF